MRVAPPPGMLEALERDLGLSAAQAQARLLNEARLTPIAEQLGKLLGPRFGGAWLRGNSAHTLVVATTSAADIPLILAAGAQADVVTRSLGFLEGIKEKIDNTLAVAQAVQDIVVNVDVVRASVAVEDAGSLPGGFRQGGFEGIGVSWTFRGVELR
ncbi:hypothetical protein [Streptosporangium sp. NPDC023615]|uniref:hypothetical protein n=1 Tax=Streptosporangium sp. NPDC023615 TaxID=3154794 RepID=UPI003414DB26